MGCIRVSRCFCCSLVSSLSLSRSLSVSLSLCLSVSLSLSSCLWASDRHPLPTPEQNSRGVHGFWIRLLPVQSREPSPRCCVLALHWWHRRPRATGKVRSFYPRCYQDEQFNHLLVWPLFSFFVFLCFDWCSWHSMGLIAPIVAHLPLPPSSSPHRNASCAAGRLLCPLPTQQCQSRW